MTGRKLNEYGDNSGSGGSGSGSDGGSDNLFEDVDESAVEAAEEAQEAEDEAADEAADAAEEAAEEAEEDSEDMAVSAATTTGGEDCTVDFCENQVSSDYLLRYKVNVPDGMTLDTCNEECTISFESIYDGEAWVSVGFSTDGIMVGSDAVIGIPGELPLKYIMTAESNDGVQPMSEDRQTLTDASVVEVTNGQTIMKFTKLLSETGEIDINAGDNIFLWANGYSNTLGLHKGFSSVNVNLSSGSVEVRSAPNMSAWLAHGIMAFIAWGVLVPFAVQSSMFRSLLPKGKNPMSRRTSVLPTGKATLWFTLHRAFNGVAFSLTIALFAVAVAYTAKEKGDHFHQTHQIVGLSMSVGTVMMVVGGVFRPHLPPPQSGEKKSKKRQAWEIGHRVKGLLLLAIGFWQMWSGIKWYSYKYGVDGSDVQIAYWVWIGLMIALIVTGFVFSMNRIRNARKDTTSSDAKPQPDTAQNTLRASATDSGDAIGEEDQT